MILKLIVYKATERFSKNIKKILEFTLLSVLNLRKIGILLELDLDKVDKYIKEGHKLFKKGR